MYFIRFLPKYGLVVTTALLNLSPALCMPTICPDCLPVTLVWHIKVALRSLKYILHYYHDDYDIYAIKLHHGKCGIQH